MKHTISLAAAALAVSTWGVGCQHPQVAQEGRADIAALLVALNAAKQPTAALAAVEAACATNNSCRCVESAVRAALDADLHELATRSLDTAPKACAQSSTLLGQRAEALARAGDATAQQAADLVLKTDPQNQYAELALARIIYDKSKMGETSEHAEKALKLGRGAEAERLLGRSALARSLFKEAEGHFQNVLKQNPNDAEAAFSSGVCADKVGDYLGAREGFLQALRIDPKHVQARIYLVVLTHNVGANDEARHHLQKLAEVLPKDAPELLQLEQLLSGSGADGGAPSPVSSAPSTGTLTVQGKH